jgi:formiminotetrahydrofolate cyclodeaminase
MQAATIADLSVSELVSAIGGDGVSPGAGAAAAVALALAAACAAKAVSVSLKHAANDSALQGSLDCFTELAHRALQGADADAEAFTRFIHERNPSVATQLVKTDLQLASLTGALKALIEHARPHIHSTVASDLYAAERLADTARQIHERNISETLEPPGD